MCQSVGNQFVKIAVIFNGLEYFGNFDMQIQDLPNEVVKSNGVKLLCTTHKIQQFSGSR